MRQAVQHRAGGGIEEIMLAHYAVIALQVEKSLQVQHLQSSGTESACADQRSMMSRRSGECTASTRIGGRSTSLSQSSSHPPGPGCQTIGILICVLPLAATSRGPGAARC